MASEKRRWFIYGAVGVILISGIAVAALQLGLAERIWPPKKDLFGDPLPRGAIARMGTVRFLPRHDVWAVALSPDGKTVATGSMPGSVSSVLELWDAVSGKRLGKLELESDGLIGANNIISVAWSPDSRRLVVGHSRKAEVWDVDKRQAIKVLEYADDQQCSFWSLRWSPSGAYIAAAASNSNGPGGKVCLWESDAGNLLHAKEHHREIHSVAFSRDSRRLAASGYGFVHVRDVETFDPEMRLDGATLHGLNGLPQNVWSVAFSPNGESIAGGVEIGDSVSSVFIWNSKTGGVRSTFEEFEGHYAEVAFAPNGNTVFTGGWRDEIRLWDVETQQQRARLFGHGLVGRFFNLSRDGQKLATGDRRISIWDVEAATLSKPQACHGSHVMSAAFLKNGEIALSAGGDGKIRFWEMETGRLLQEIEGHDAPVSCLAVSRDESLLASGDIQGIIRTWYLPEAALEREWDGHSGGELGVTSIAFLPDGSLLTSGWDQAVRIWDVSGPVELKSIELESAVLGVAADAAGEFAAIGGTERPVEIWNLESQTKIAAIPKSNLMLFQALDVSRDGRLVGARVVNPDFSIGGSDAANTKPYLLQVWDVEQQKPRWTSPRHYSMSITSDIAFDPTAALVAVTDRNSIDVYSVANGRRMAHWEHPDGSIRLLMFTPDGNRLVSGGGDANLLVWDVSRLRGSSRK